MLTSDRKTSLAPGLLAAPPSNDPLPVSHTPSMSVGLYPQPPAARLEQQQRETVGERKEEGRQEVEDRRRLTEQTRRMMHSGRWFLLR